MPMIRTFTFTAMVSRLTHAQLDAFLREQKDLWNAGLEERLAAYQKTGKGVSYLTQQKGLTELRQDCPEHNQYSCHAQRSALRRLDRAFKNFFRRVKAGEKPGFPRFKPAHRMRSFDTQQFSLHAKGGLHSVAVKGIGRFRFKGELPDNAKCKAFRVVRTAKRIKVQLVCALPDVRLVDNRPALGLDVGVDCLYALSNGETVPGLKRDLSRIKRCQRKLARAKRGSNNRRKKRATLAKAWQTERERTRGQLHELSAKLIKQHTANWFVEDLNIQGMTRKGKGKRGLNRSILEQNWGEFISMLSYKAERAGGKVEKVDAAYTSKTCNNCGGVQHDLGRREHLHCVYCGHSDHRDVNAAKNMLLGNRVSQAGRAARRARSKAVTAGLSTASA